MDVWMWEAMYRCGTLYLDMTIRIRIRIPKSRIRIEYPDRAFHIQGHDPISRYGIPNPDMAGHIHGCRDPHLDMEY